MELSRPRIVNRRATVVSPWVTLIEKEVCFQEGCAPEVYHSLTQRAYVAVLALTRLGEVPIVRQYRPAIEDYTWELPAGTVDPPETSVQAAARELMEETGLHADHLHEIGTYYPDTGRLSMSSIGFFAVCADSPIGPPAEQRIEMRLVPLADLYRMARHGEFRHQLHLALIASAALRGHIPLHGSYDAE